MEQKKYVFYLTTAVFLLTNLELSTSAKCSYSFIINEMDPENCPCLLDHSGDLDTKTWIPTKKSLEEPGTEGIQSDDKAGYSRNPDNRLILEQTRELRENLTAIQKKYDSMYVKMKDLEIKMYKESMHNLELHNLITRQEQTLKDYRYITERLKQASDQMQWNIEKHKLQIQDDLNSLQSNVDSNTDMLQKHNDYLMGLELQHERTVSDRRYEDVTIDRRMHQNKDKYIPVRNAAEETCDGISKNATKYKDCEELYERGHRQSGVYYITPDYTPCPIPVYCDMHTDGGGWLLFQRRQDGSQNFNRNWTDYRQGFGDLNGEFWLGNDNIFLLTNQASYKLRIDVWDFNKTRKYAQYMYFMIGGERDKYRLSILNHTGELRDGLSHHNGQLFSTPDEDNDSWNAHHCAREWSGGWWYDKCWFVVLNGWYFHSPNVKYKGIAWNHWKSEQLEKSEMKIKPSDYI